MFFPFVYFFYSAGSCSITTVIAISFSACLAGFLLGLFACYLRHRDPTPKPIPDLDLHRCHDNARQRVPLAESQYANERVCPWPLHSNMDQPRADSAQYETMRLYAEPEFVKLHRIDSQQAVLTPNVAYNINTPPGLESDSTCTGNGKV